MPRGHHASRETALALRELLAAVQVDRRHDVPYLGGISRDARRLYLDKDAPRTFPSRGGRAQILPFIAVHEMVEDALMDRFGLAYQPAHVIGKMAEKSVVEAMGHKWSEYQRFNERIAAECERKEDLRPPRDLDLRPYDMEEDAVRVRRLHESLARQPLRPVRRMMPQAK
ncbi:MAG: hypothetical protein LC620_07595 [Halobacteriales archaeon]|nr:hypothetical protein [Halobacteriales archaeon]